MGPFVPDIISENLNLVVALLLGVAFGAVLEQAGFSSSRRLAGVFYGYDFTVLRVFFTAGITALLGVVILGRLGYLDRDIIYINPTFFGPALVGGAIMGVGFILGGYCPGTSICAAAIGKKDAIAFVAGGLLGVYVFGELFPLYDTFYGSGAWGPLKVFESLHLSEDAFVLMLILVAIAAFAVTTRIEKRVNPATGAYAWSRGRHALAALGLVALGCTLLVLPDRKTTILKAVEDEGYRQSHPVVTMDADELAFRILDRDPRTVLVDLRPAEEYAKTALPGAVNIPIEALFGKEYAQLLGTRNKQRVFIDGDGSLARKAALVSASLGYENARALDGGFDRFRETILAFKPLPETDSPQATDTQRFRAKASVALRKMMEDSRAEASRPKAATKKISGGC